jgi:3D (Asp-Asp-Asp) domain-containing protein
MRGGCLLAQWPTARRPAFWGAAAAIAAGGLFFATHLHRAQVTIDTPTGTHTRSIWTLDSSWRALLRSVGLRVGPHDWVNQRLGDPVTDPLVIRRAVPLMISTFRHRFHVWTTEYRVGQVLASLGVRLGRLDVVHPGFKARVVPGEHIDVIRRWIVTQTITAALAYTTQYEPDAQLFAGNRVVLRTGRDGRRLETVRILVQDGKPVRRLLARSRVLERPVNELIAYGTLDTIDRGGTVVNFSREITMTATAYWPDPVWSNGYTAMGLRAQYGVVAVDPSVIPLGTRLYIPGYGFAIAADTGSAIVGDRVDLCFDDAAQAIDWGVRTVQVFVLR